MKSVASFFTLIFFLGLAQAEVLRLKPESLDQMLRSLGPFGKLQQPWTDFGEWHYWKSGRDYKFLRAESLLEDPEKSAGVLGDWDEVEDFLLGKRVDPTERARRQAALRKKHPIGWLVDIETDFADRLNLKIDQDICSVHIRMLAMAPSAYALMPRRFGQLINELRRRSFEIYLSEDATLANPFRKGRQERYVNFRGRSIENGLMIEASTRCKREFMNTRAAMPMPRDIFWTR